ncbi:uncharacterized protein [Temnothorax nylanderi]|uniref:uncharacterized protein n=1 Tax=Temnothorax nylanderi TaxID=102681 RepID=UPI003A880205
MVLRCFLCKTTYNKNEKDVQMHKVPRKEHIMKLWLSVLNIEQINPNARLCSKHFTRDDFMTSVVAERKYLKPDAIPSMNLQNEDEKDTGCNSNKEESIQDTQHCNMKRTPLKRSLSMEQSAEEEVPLKIIRTINDIDMKKVSQSPLERKYLKPDAIPSMNLQNKDEKDTGCNSSKEESIQNTQHCNVKRTPLKRSLSMEQSAEEEVPLKNIRTINDIDIKKVSQSPLEAEACLEVLIEELHEKRKEVKHLRNKVGKLQKTVKDLRSLMKTLKDNKLITSTARNTLKSIESPALVAVVQKVLSGKHRFNAFPSELKTFATTLHFYSPKAYQYCYLQCNFPQSYKYHRYLYVY